MRIGLISDTHIPEVGKEIPPSVLELFKGVDLILHAGDIYAHTVLDDLARLAPVLAARGDDDYVRRDTRVQDKHVLEVAGKVLWLVHIGPLRFSSGEWLSRDAMALEEDESPDIIVFG